jgi:radical SAM superfamily enzyme YgiQ (UPF0313 family)
MGKTHRRRGGIKFVDEIEFLHRNYGINYFSIMDDNFTLHRGHIFEFCDEVRRRKLDIQFETPNGIWINSLNEKVIAALASVGLVHTSVAIESGSDYIRNEVVGKNLKRETIFEHIRILKKYNIMTAGFFIMGFPEDTYETLADTYKMMNQLKLDRMGAMTAMPFPGTKLFEQVKRDNLFVNPVDLNNLWKKPLSHAQSDFIIKPYNLSIEELKKWRSKFAEVNDKYLNYNKNRFDSTILNAA